MRTKRCGSMCWAKVLNKPAINPPAMAALILIITIIIINPGRLVSRTKHERTTKVLEKAGQTEVQSSSCTYNLNMACSGAACSFLKSVPIAIGSMVIWCKLLQQPLQFYISCAFFFKFSAAAYFI